ncbi:hypothetical protein D3C84_586410 [compost metagenome]
MRAHDQVPLLQINGVTELGRRFRADGGLPVVPEKMCPRLGRFNQPSNHIHAVGIFAINKALADIGVQVGGEHSNRRRVIAVKIVLFSETQRSQNLHSLIPSVGIPIFGSVIYRLNRRLGNFHIVLQ